MKKPRDKSRKKNNDEGLDGFLRALQRFGKLEPEPEVVYDMDALAKFEEFAKAVGPEFGMMEIVEEIKAEIELQEFRKMLPRPNPASRPKRKGSCPSP